MKLISKWMLTAAPGGIGGPVGWTMLLLLVSWFSGESSLLLNTADAQVVVVGPAGGVEVRAPLLSVDVMSFHRRTRLRVPYTAISTSFYRSYRSLPSIPRVFPLPVPRPYVLTAVPAYPVLAVTAYPAVVYAEMPGYECSGVLYPDGHVARQHSYDSVISSSRARLELPLQERLRAAAETLARTLSLREDGDVWLNYLGLQRIIENVDYGRPASELRDLIIKYEGVVTNGMLPSIQYARGFATSRDLLRQYIGAQALSNEQNDERVLVPSSLTPTASGSQTPLPQLPKKEPAKGVPVDPAAVEKFPASGTGIPAKQLPGLTQVPEGENLPRASEKIVQPTSL